MSSDTTFEHAANYTRCLGILLGCDVSGWTSGCAFGKSGLHLRGGAPVCPPKKLRPKKEKKRYTHEFKKAIEESERLNRSQALARATTNSPSGSQAPVRDNGSSREVATNIDPDISEQPASD